MKIAAINIRIKNTTSGVVTLTPTINNITGHTKIKRELK